MDCQDSRVLVTAASRGDGRALDELVARHLPALRAYVRLRCGPELRARESASDIVQSACRDVLAGLSRFEWQGEAAFRDYLYTAARNKIADRGAHWATLKRDARREVRPQAPWGGAGSPSSALSEVYATLASPSEQAAGRESLERIERAFDRLDERDREIIVLARLVGLPHEDLARRFECSVNAARQRLFRALGNLSLALDDDAAD